jgi:7-cyano-7-deazaguanine synthase
MKKAVVLLSGGLDSITCLALAQNQGFECLAISFDYGQRHISELVAAKKIASLYKVKHTIIPISKVQFEGSALTDANQAVPDHQPGDAIPVTYVPARNTIFLSYALGLAEVSQANDIYIGVSCVDYSSYPDCRPEYIEAFQKLANLATKVGVEEGTIQIQTPLIHLSKAETVQLGIKLGVDYSMTVSCYQANAEGKACGNCDSCTYRKKGFKEAGLADPTHYVS